MKKLVILLVFLPFIGLSSGEVITSCPDNWVAYEGSCYYFHFQHESFTEAEHYCQSHHAHLVHINDAQETAMLRDRIKHFQAELGWWIGLTDEEVEGEYKWTDNGGILTSGSYNDWWPGEPNDAGHNEDCVHLYSVRDYHWNDYPCSSQEAFICEVNAEYLNEVVPIG